jgi:glycosyltransferase involved in cell wall biosynthesis
MAIGVASTTGRVVVPPRPDDVCVVVPMHNESSVIGSVVSGLLERFALVVCVDDGSSDDSAEVARQAGASVVRHAVNLGQGGALQTGIRHGLRHPGAGYFVTFDADGQHDPADAARMVDVARSGGVDVVLGSRFLGATSNVPPSRRALLRAAILFTRLTTGLSLTDTHNGLRVFTRAAAQDLEIQLGGMAHASEVLNHVAARKLRFREIPVSIAYTEYSRAKGQSGLNALNIAFDLFVQKVYATR